MASINFTKFYDPYKFTKFYGKYKFYQVLWLV